MKKQSFAKSQSLILQEIAYNYSGTDIQTHMMHAHEGLEILHILEGSGSVVIKDAIYEMEPNTLYLICSEDFHCTHPDDATIYKRNTMQFSPYKLISLLELFDIDDLYNLFRHNKGGNRYALDAESSKKINASFFNIMEEDSNRQYGYLAGIMSEVVNILFVLKRNSSLVQADKKLVGVQEIALKIMQHVTEHMTDFSLDEMADALHMNKFYLCHSFKRATGLTIHYYLMERRIAGAKALLKQENTPISTIATDLGFSSFSLFSRVFKKATGITPSKYRKDFRI